MAKTNIIVNVMQSSVFAFAVVAILVVVFFGPRVHAAQGCGVGLSRVVRSKILHEDRWARAQSVKYAGHRSGRHGAAQFLVERRGRSRWGSEFPLMVLARQGDPRQFIQVFDERTASFFGFEMNGDRQMWVPSADEFIGAWKSVKDVLTDMARRNIIQEQYVPVANFYRETVTPESGWESVYLTKFAEEIAFPLSNIIHQDYGGIHELIHDLAYHTSTLMLEQPILD